jgi:hypothetical protein
MAPPHSEVQLAFFSNLLSMIGAGPLDLNAELLHAGL